MDRRVFVAAICSQIPGLSRTVSAKTTHVDVRAFGAKGDGKTDDTAALQKAHEAGMPVYYPKAPEFYRITSTISVRGSVFGENAQIRFTQDGSGRTTIFKVIRNESPIEFSGLVLDGEYRTGANSEFSHGIELYAAKDIHIHRNIIQNVYGDCVYLGSYQSAFACTNVVIENNFLSNPRRCNVAVVCASDVMIRDNLISKVNDYVCAIDLEPNRNGFDYVQNVSVVGNKFDIKEPFLECGVNTGKPNRNLLVARNYGRGTHFVYVTQTALLQGANIVDNSFEGIVADGAMLLLDNVAGVNVRGNTDRTASKLAGYRSVRLIDLADVSFSNNIGFRD